MTSHKVRINVGGTLFVTYLETLQTYPDTRLGKLSPESDDYDAVNKTYYFDRDAECFSAILNFYRWKELHVPTHVCSIAMRKELEFWDIPKKHVSQCCWKAFYQVDEDLEILSSLSKACPCVKSQWEERDLKTRIWLFLDGPSSSLAAKVWNGVYLLIVAISCLAICLETIAYFRRKPYLYQLQKSCDSSNNTGSYWLNNPKANLFFCSDPIPEVFCLELGCLIFFTVEFIVCFIASPDKKRFFKTPFYTVIFATLVTMWLAVLLEANKNWVIGSSTYQALFILTKFLSTVRILLFLRIVTNYSPLCVLLLSVKSSFRDLVLLVICILLATIIFASLVYQAEFSHASSMPNAFVSMWYAVITMTTVGYGDVYPLTNAGKIFGAACAVFGLLVLALPVAVIASNFSAYYSRNKDRLRHFS